MNILALDLGTKTGWAFSDGGRVESGTQDFSPKRGDSAGMRYIAFRKWLQDMAAPYSRSLQSPHVIVDLIVYEMPHLRGGAAATVLAGLQTRVEEFCAEHEIEHSSVHSATLKKFVTGSGRGDKEAMAVAAHGRGWINVETRYYDDNEVDAVCLLRYALAELAPRAEGAHPEGLPDVQEVP